MPHCNSETLKTYTNYLTVFMSFKDNVAYSKQHPHQFTQEQLGAIKPNDIVEFFRLKAFGDRHATNEDESKMCRSNTLLFYKKAISHFMPNRLSKWDHLSERGNPTQSIPVSEVIGLVKLQECRKQGKESQARRPLQRGEFEQMIKLLQASSKPAVSYGMVGFFKFQFNLIARLDCVAHLRYKDLLPCKQFPSFIICKIAWSKNIQTKKQSPHQLVMGSIDPKYCPLIGLAIHMESSIPGNGDGWVFSFAGKGDKVPACSKAKVSSELKKIIDGTEFQSSMDGKLGTHSFRKFSSTVARRTGCHRDDVDARGRWANNRVSDGYMDVTIPYPDAKVASALSRGGPCRYKAKEGSNVTDSWILQHVAFSMASKVEEPIAKVLGSALLWAAFDSEVSKWMPTWLQTRIVDAYKQIGSTLVDGTNPMERVRVYISGNDGCLFITDIGNDDVSNENAGVAAAGNGMNNDQFNALHSIIRAGDERATGQTEAIKEMHKAIKDLQNQLQTQLKKLEMSVERNGKIKFRSIRAGAGMTATEPLEEPTNANLSRTPRSLHALWNEYMFGIGGRKAAKYFTSTERGKVKAIYCRRKLVWDCIGNLIRSGMDATRAIEKIYSVYGRNSSVTKIINSMRDDKKNRGGHPELAV